MRLSVEQGLRGVAGTMILLSLILTVTHSHYWIYFTAFIGLNLLQSSFTNWCPMVWLLQRLGLPRCQVTR